MTAISMIDVVFFIACLAQAYRRITVPSAIEQAGFAIAVGGLSMIEILTATTPLAVVALLAVTMGNLYVTYLGISRGDLL